MADSFTYALDDFADRTASWWLQCAADEGVTGELLSVTAAGEDGVILFPIVVFETDEGEWEVPAGHEETEFPAHVDEIEEQMQMWRHIVERFGGLDAMRDGLDIEDASEDDVREAFWSESEDADEWVDLLHAVAWYEQAKVLAAVVARADSIGLARGKEVETRFAWDEEERVLTVEAALEQLELAAEVWDVDETDAALFYETPQQREWFEALACLGAS